MHAPQTGASVYEALIASGKVQLVYRRADACEFGLTVFGPSQTLGAKTLFDPDSEGFVLITLTEVVVVPIRRDQLLSWLAEHPEIGEQMLRLFSRWEKECQNLLVDFALADARVRTASRLVVLSKRFGYRDGDALRLAHGMGLEDFAIMVGVAPEVVEATLRGFADRGWIRLQGGDVLVVDTEALKAICRYGDGHMSDVA